MLESERRRIIALIVKKIEGNLRKKENTELENWAILSADNRQLLNELMDKHKLTQALLEYGNLDGTPIWNRLTAELPALLSVNKEKPPPENVWRRWIDHIRSILLQPKLVAGVCLVALVVIAAPFLWRSHNDPQKPGPEQTAIPTVKTGPERDLLPPTRQRVHITLPNDSILDPTALPKGESRRYGDIEITRTGDETVVYAIRRSPGSESTGDNIVATERGGGYTVRLPDGSNVRLNAASSLRFASTFGEKDRLVKLQGEGYFEVAPHNKAGKNKKIPFVVHVQRERDVVNISAFGTLFNVMAYKEDGFIRTTLLKGNIQIQDRGHIQPLHPGEQYVQYLSGKDLLVPSADTNGAIAWKNDWFVFKEEPLPHVMNQLCRWYDAYVTYANADTPDVSVITKGSRKDPASAVLRRIEASGGVHFEIEDGRHIIVSSR